MNKRFAFKRWRFRDLLCIQTLVECNLLRVLANTSSRYDQYSSEHRFCCVRAHECSCTHKIRLYASQLSHSSSSPQRIGSTSCRDLRGYSIFLGLLYHPLWYSVAGLGILLALSLCKCGYHFSQHSRIFFHTLLDLYVIYNALVVQSVVHCATCRL